MSPNSGAVRAMVRLRWATFGPRIWSGYSRALLVTSRCARLCRGAMKISPAEAGQMFENYFR